MVGATAIAIPGIQEVAADGNVAEINGTGYATLQEAFNAAKDGETVTLLENINLTVGVTNTGNAVLDLNGKDITGAVNGKLITNSGTLTIQGTGHIYNQDISAQGHDAIYNTGTLTINGGIYGDADDDQNNANALNRGAAIRNYGGTVTINNGSFTACDNFTNGGYAYALINDNGGTMTINDATVYGKNNGNIANNYGTVTIKDGTYTLNNAGSYYSLYIDGEDGVAKTIVEGGTFNNTSNNGLLHTDDANNASLEIKGGSFTYNILTNQANPNVAVSGGTFSSAIPEAFCEDGCTLIDNGNGTYSVSSPSYVAQIGSNKFETLEAAVEAAEDGATIQVIKAGEYAIPAITKNVTIEGAVDGVAVKHEANSAITTIASGKTATFKNITFDLGTLQMATAHGFGTTNGSNGALVMDGCTINGALNLFGESTFTNCNFNAEGIYNIWAVNDNATFTGCTFNNKNRAVNVYDQKKGSTTKNVSFSGCTFNGSEKKKAAVNIHHNPDPVGAAAKYAVSITNCTISGTWASTVEETGEPDGSTICYSPLWMISDIVNWEDGDITVTVDGVAQDVSKFSPVAKIGDTKYTSLEAAVNAAAEGDEILILKNFTLTTVTTSPNAKYNVNVNKSVTINGDGHTITSSEGKRALALTGDGNNITLKNLTVVNNKSDWCVGILNNPTVTLDATTIDGSGYNNGYNQPLTIGGEGAGGVKLYVTNGSVIKTNNEGTAHYSITVWRPSEIKVTDSKLIGWAGIYLKPAAAGSTVKIEGSEIVSKGIAGYSSGNSFAAIVSEGDDIEIEIKDTKINTTPAEDTYESLFSITGSNNVVKILGTTEYETTDMTLGAVTYNPTVLFNNKVYFDDETKAAFAKYFTDEVGPAIANEKEEPISLYPLVYAPEVYYYWANGQGGYNGVYTNFAYPFEKTEEFILGDGEYIKLKKDITLDHNIVNPLASGTINLLLDNYTITKGDYSLQLKEGQSFKTDKQTNIFSAVDADYKVVETAVEGGYTYTVVAKEYVAQIGEGEDAVKYESLEKAIEAISTVTTVNHQKSGLTINQYKANGTVTLLADCEGNGIVVDSGSELTIDFAGHTYSVTGDLVGSDQTEYNGFQLLQNSNVTFKSTAEELGVINSAKAIFLVQNYSNLTLENMTLDGSNLSGSGAYTLSNNCGNVVIENSTITAKEGAGNFAFDVCRYKNYPSVSITVKGESVINGDVEVSASDSDAKEGFSLMLEGGTLNGEIVLDGSAKTAMANTPDKAKVSKRNALTDIAAPASYIWKDNGDETSTLAKLLARVTHCSGMDYDNDEEMWSSTNCSTAAEVEQNVSLNICEDFASDEWYADRVWVYGELNANLTLGNNQYVYIAELGADANFTGTISAAEGYILVKTDVKEDFDDVYGREHKSAKLYTVRRDPNYAKIKVVKTDGTEYGYDALLSSSTLMNIGDGDKMILLDDVDYGYNVPWYPGFDLTIDLNGHTLTNTKGGVLGLSVNKTLTIIDSSDSKTGKVALENITSSPVINASSNNNAKLVIESGSVIAPSSSNKGAIVAGSNNEVSITGGCFAGKLITEGSTATIQISGGVFSQEPAEEYCAEGYIVANNTDPETKEVYPYTVKTGAYVAEIVDGAKYETLEAAFAAAEEGATVKVLTDITLDKAATLPAGKRVTLDLNGKTISAATNTIRNMGNLTVVDNAGNGKIVSTGYFAISVGNNSTTTISNAESKEFAIESVEGAIITGTVTGATININGGTLSASDNAVVAGNGSAGYGGNIINIAGGTFNGGITSAGYVACGIYAPNNDVWNITGGTFNITGGAGVVQRAGTVNISDDVVFNVTGSATGKVGDSRVVVPCAAIVFESEAAYPGMTDAASMNVSGGTFNAESDAVAYVAAEGAATHIAISGGKFSSKVPEECCAPNYVPTTEPEDDYYTVQTKEDAGIFELIDGEVYPYKDDTADRNATSITYKRKFPSNNYNAWYVPFDYTITEEDLQNFDFYKFHMISASSSTGNANVNNVTAAFIHLQKITTPGTKLRGNSPYVIVLKNAVDETAVYEFKMEGDNLKLLKPNNGSAFQMMSADFYYDFYGTYDKYGASKPKEWFALNSGKLSPNNNAGASINQYRWVLKLTPRGENSDYSKIDFGFIEDEDATGLSTISADEDNQIEGIYSVNGSKHDNLEKGINIIRYKNGTTKKVIIK